MSFCFYPKHEYACPQLRHCPHLGGAALGTLVLAANEADEEFGWLNRQLDGARKSVTQLVAENEALKRQIEKLKLELKLERQTKFATNRQRRDTSRTGEVSRDLLGEDFAGTLVTDCYSAYDAQGAKAKQKCLSHLARTARDWQKLTAAGSAADQFFQTVKTWVKRGCEFHRQRARLSARRQAGEQTWLREELQRLQGCSVDHEKAATLQERIKRYADCWLVFLDDPRVPPTNNQAERCLRPLVILRKITFGHRTRHGAQRMAWIMTVKETARRHGRRVIDVLYRLCTQFPDRVLRYIYGGPGMAGS